MSNRSAEIDYGSKEDAERVLKVMREIIEKFSFVSVEDFNSLIGLPSTHSDSKQGWIVLKDVEIEESYRGHFRINLPDPVTIK